MSLVTFYHGFGLQETYLGKDYIMGKEPHLYCVNVYLYRILAINLGHLMVTPTKRCPFLEPSG
jgi:hypothetical protein